MSPQKEKVVSTRVSEAVQRKIVRLAEEERRPVSNLVAILLEEALQGRNRKETA